MMGLVMRGVLSEPSWGPVNISLLQMRTPSTEREQETCYNPGPIASVRYDQLYATSRGAVLEWMLQAV